MDDVNRQPEVNSDTRSDAKGIGGYASRFPCLLRGPSSRTRACRVAACGYSTWSSPGAPHRGWRVAGQRAGAWRWHSWPISRVAHGADSMPIDGLAWPCGPLLALLGPLLVLYRPLKAAAGCL